MSTVFFFYLFGGYFLLRNLVVASLCFFPVLVPSCRLFLSCVFVGTPQTGSKRIFGEFWAVRRDLEHVVSNGWNLLHVAMPATTKKNFVVPYGNHPISRHHRWIFRQRIAAMQLAVAPTFSDHVNSDPLAEFEPLENFRGFLSEAGVPEDAASVTLNLLSACQFVAVARVQNPAPQVMDQLEELEVVDVMDDGFPQGGPTNKPDKRRRAENTLVQQLGADPKKVRSDLFNLGTMCLSLGRKTPSSYIGFMRAFIYLVWTTRGFDMLVTKCQQKLNIIRSAACVRKLEQQTKPKVIRATLRRARRRTS